MLDAIFERRDVKQLIEKAANHSINHNKISPICKEYIDEEDALYIIIDALFKYKTIIDDDYLITDFVYSLEKLMRKMDNYVDIERGINKLLGLFCAKKLWLKNTFEYENKKKILEHIYKTYIIKGYVFHGMSSVYKSDIIKSGLTPEQYNNRYDKFIKIKKTLKKHPYIMEKTFKEDYIVMTDDLKKAYYYAFNSPMYLSNLLSNNNIIKDKNNSYLKKDYKKCFSNLNKLCIELNLNINNKNYIKKICKEEWNNLKNDISKPTILLVKRESLGIDYLSNIEKIINESKDCSLDISINKIINNKNNKIKVYKKIENKDIEILELYSYKELYLKEKEIINKNSIQYIDQKYMNAYGKISILILLGSIFITLGVIISIIMLNRGI